MQQKNEHAWQDYIDSIREGELTDEVFEKVEETKRNEEIRRRKILEH